MGAFITNLQVHLDHTTKEAGKKLIMDGIRSYMTEEGYGESHTLQQNVSQTDLAIGWVEDCKPWIAIYKEIIEEEDLVMVDRLARYLSSTLGQAVLSIMLHDSDLLHVQKFTKGQAEAVLEYHYGIGVREECACWMDLLTDDSKQEQWNTCFEDVMAMPEDVLGQLGALLGLNSIQALISYRDLDDTQLSSLEYMNFEKASQSIEKPLGPTKLEFVHLYQTVDTHIQEEGVLNLGIFNLGQASRGIRILLSGEALKDECIKSVSYQIKTLSKKEIIAEGSLQEGVSTNGDKLFYRDIEEVPFTPGAAYDEGEYAYVLVDERDRYERGYQVALGIQGCKPCHSTFRIYMAPLSNLRKGGIGHQIAYNVSE